MDHLRHRQAERSAAVQPRKKTRQLRLLVRINDDSAWRAEGAPAIRILAAISRARLGIIPRFDREAFMKALVAALIAAAILYLADNQYNDGRYAQVLQQAVTSLLPG